MSITSLSFTFVNTYAAPAAKPAAAAERPAQSEQTHKHSCGESRPASRQNRLVEAMMTALSELGLGGQAAQPAAAAATGTSGAAVAATAADASAAVATAQTSAAAAVAASAAESAPSTDAPEQTAVATTEAAAQPSVTLESAVRQFAHELFSALRQVGSGESSDQGSNRDRNRIDGEGGRRHHHGHHGWRREGYGDMSQRLNALSQTFAAPAAAAAADAAPVSTSISITLTVQNGVVSRSPAEAVTTNAAVAATADSAQTAATAATSTPSEAVPAAPAATDTAAQEVARNPLLDAFSQLFGALKPQAAQTDMADKLRSFLQTLAQAMRPESMNHGTPMPQVGSLVNVTA
jgi:hypothetical protein